MGYEKKFERRKGKQKKLTLVKEDYFSKKFSKTVLKPMDFAIDADDSQIRNLYIGDWMLSASEKECQITRIA